MKGQFVIKFDGPPMSGKTRCLELVKKFLESQGYKVEHDVAKAEHVLKVSWTKNSLLRKEG